MDFDLNLDVVESSWSPSLLPFDLNEDINVDEVPNVSDDVFVEVGPAGGEGNDRVAGDVPSMEGLKNGDEDDLSIDMDEDVVEEIDADGDLMLRMMGYPEGGRDGRKGNSVCVDAVETPTEGMEFSTGEEFVAHIHRYAHSQGFQARIRSSDRYEEYKVVSAPCRATSERIMESAYSGHYRIRMVCQRQEIFTSRAAFTTTSSQSCKNNCPYGVIARHQVSGSGIWRISSVKGSHNHACEPTESRHLPRYRVISLSDKRLMTEMNSAGVSVPHIFNIFVNRYKGYRDVPFTEADLRNFLYVQSRELMKNGDFASMEMHFNKMREESPGFFYEYDVDEDRKLKNVFWADSRCREAYKEFGDVVSFDATFVSNRYRMPFAPFIGVNHHGQSMLFGCALLGKEDADTFVWLFNTWKKCMGKDPGCILTDQDKAIGKAIEIAFPRSKHRWCLWHIMRNAAKNLGSMSVWDELYGEILGSLHDSLLEEEFEARWKEILVKYDVESNPWMVEMYEKRAKWVPVYFKSDFWAGMSSTQRSEGMNNFFKGFVNVNTNLTKFVERYGQAVCKRINEEDDATFKCVNLRSRDTSTHPFDCVFEKLFTRAKYLEFHKEVVEMGKNRGTLVRADGGVVQYDVLVKHFRAGWTKKRDFSVTLDRNSMDIACACKNFEFRGILCAHALRVFWEEEVSDVPEKYIFRRWRKDVPRKYLKEKYPMSTLYGKTQVGFVRYEAMHSICDEICVRLMNDEKLYEEGMRKLGKLKADLEAKLQTVDGLRLDFLEGIGRVYTRKPSVVHQTGHGVGETLGVGDLETVKDPIDRRGRGRGQIKRKKSMAERNSSSRRGARIGRGRGALNPRTIPIAGHFDRTTGNHPAAHSFFGHWFAGNEEGSWAGGNGRSGAQGSSSYVPIFGGSQSFR